MKRGRPEASGDASQAPRTVQPKLIAFEAFAENNAELSSKIRKRARIQISAEVDALRRRVKELESERTRVLAKEQHYEALIACVDQGWSRVEGVLKQGLGQGPAEAPVPPLLEQLVTLSAVDPSKQMPGQYVDLLDVYAQDDAPEISDPSKDGEQGHGSAPENLASSWLRNVAAEEGLDELETFGQKLEDRVQATRAMLAGLLSHVKKAGGAPDPILSAQTFRARLKLLENRLVVAHRRMASLRSQLTDEMREKKRAWRVVDDLWRRGSKAVKREKDSDASVPNGAERDEKPAAKKGKKVKLEKADGAAANGTEEHVGEVEKLRAEGKALTNELSRVRDLLDEKHRSHASLESEMAKLQARMKAWEGSKGQAAEASERLRREVVELTEACAKHRHLEQTLRTEKEELEGLWMQKLNQATLEFQQTIHENSERLAEAERNETVAHMSLRRIEDSKQGCEALLRHMKESQAHRIQLEAQVKAAQDACALEKKRADERGERLRGILASLEAGKDGSDAPGASESAAQAQIKALQSENADLSAVNEMLMSEVDSTNTACDEFRKRVGRLEDEVTAAEVAKANLMAQVSNAKSLKGEVDQVLERHKQDLTELGEWRRVWEEQRSAYQTAVRDHSNESNMLRQRALTAENARHEAHYNLSVVQEKLTKVSGNEQGLIAEVATLKEQLEACQDARIAAEKENKTLHAKVQGSKAEASKLRGLKRRSSAGPNESVDELQERLSTVEFWLNRYREAYRCRVCNLRNHDMDTVVVRCGHVMCYPCLAARLKNRNRKCPTCEGPFGEQDLFRFVEGLNSEEGV
mmetsp:Transcript_14306/g.53917  ORF Transcript_14306/g.53917 Transcript_14306/m.53917 type:complete len:812 (-) Transcript_14306:817-3252(-)